jgi:hypothetical protein
MEEVCGVGVVDPAQLASTAAIQPPIKPVRHVLRMHAFIAFIAESKCKVREFEKATEKAFARILQHELKTGRHRGRGGAFRHPERAKRVEET